jgi:DNA-directed RNA polymerase I, II, and III subunit RPABC3
MALAAPPTSEAHLFEDTFTISEIDAKKYDRVSRISAQNLSNDTNFKLDVNTELYPLTVNDTIHVVLASTLNPDGDKDEVKGWREALRGEQSLAAIYDYVCHGKIYRFDESHEDNMCV